MGQIQYNWRRRSRRRRGVKIGMCGENPSKAVTKVNATELAGVSQVLANGAAITQIPDVKLSPPVL